MALRELRAKRTLLFLFTASASLGIAALVGIHSLTETLDDLVLTQGKTLLGADFSVRGSALNFDEVKELAQKFDAQVAREISLRSMVRFPKGDNSRLVNVRALDNNFPFYGEFEASPAEAASQAQRASGALIDGVVLSQFEQQVGDTIMIGALSLPIRGTLKKIPGENAGSSFIGPRVVIPFDAIGETNLIQMGSIVRNKIYFRCPVSDENGTKCVQLHDELEAYAEQKHHRIETVKNRQESVGRVIENVSNFLELTALTSLLLGCIGIGVNTELYMREKRPVMSILRLLGGSEAQIASLYIVGLALLCLVSVVLGTLLGLALQWVIPPLFSNLLPFELHVRLSTRALLQGTIAGFVLALTAVVPAVLRLARVSALSSLRANGDPTQMPSRREVLLSMLPIFIIFLLVAILETTPIYGLAFAAGIIAVLGALTGIAKLVVFMTRKFLPRDAPFALRQGIANLFRPRNQTTLTILALGTGLFLIFTIVAAERMLLDQVSMTGNENQPNVVLFDIQTDQRTGVRSMLDRFSVSVLDEVPIVTMRLVSVKGVSVEQLRQDRPEIPGWVLSREYRSTYRDHLFSSERIVAGEWFDNSGFNPERVPISIEQEIARDLGVAVGDEVKIDVQGVLLTTYIGSIREVDWKRVQPNFFLVFPRGVLEQAPQFYAIVGEAPSEAALGALERESVRTFPNVSIIDLRLVLETMNRVLDRIARVLQFMGGFTVITGFVLLLSTIVSSKSERVRELVLLRTLGASRALLSRIMVVEYVALATISVLTAMILSSVAIQVLAKYYFDSLYRPDGSILTLSIGFILVVSFIAWTLNRRIVHSSPAAALRETN